jgi:hypothetical protein
MLSCVSEKEPKSRLFVLLSIQNESLLALPSTVYASIRDTGRARRSSDRKVENVMVMKDGEWRGGG